jgi:glucose/arabinose dehydrogenase
LSAVILSISTMTFFKSPTQTVYGQASVNDSALSVEAAVEGLYSPTCMVFVDDSNILVLEKEGSVRLFSNGVYKQSQYYKCQLMQRMKGDY